MESRSFTQVEAEDTLEHRQRESSANRLVDELLALREIPIAERREEYQTFVRRVEELLDTAERSSSVDHGEQGERNHPIPSDRLLVCFSALEALTNDENVTAIEAYDGSTDFLERLTMDIVRDGVRNPELCARCSARIQSRKVRARVTDGVGLKLPSLTGARSLDELRAYPMSERAHFYRQYLAELDAVQPDEVFEDGTIGIPLEVRIQRPSVSENALWATQILKETHDFHDGREIHLAFAQEMIKTGTADNLCAGSRMRSLGAPTAYVHSEVVDLLLREKEGRVLTRGINARCFDQTPTAVILSLLEKPEGVELLFGKKREWSKLSSKNIQLDPEVAERIVALNRSEIAMSNLQILSKESQRILLADLLSSEEGIQRCTSGLPHSADASIPAETAYLLAEKGSISQVMESIHVFFGVSLEELARAAMRTPASRRSLAGELAVFYREKNPLLTAQDAEQLIREGYLRSVIEWPQVFSGLDQNALIRRGLREDEQSISSRKGVGVLKALDGIGPNLRAIGRSLDAYEHLQPDIAQTLLATGDASVMLAVVSYIQVFDGLDHNAIMAQALGAGRDVRQGALRSIARYRGLDSNSMKRILEVQPNQVLPIESFSSEVHQALAERCFSDSPAACADSLGEFATASLSASIADRLVSAGFLAAVFEHTRVFREISPQLAEKLRAFEVLTARIEESPSRTVRRMKEVLIEQLSTSPHPEKEYEKIEKLFLRNHIPLVGKTFLASEIIYGTEHYKKAFSPLLRDASPREARMLFYRDLLKIHVETGNPSLRAYFEGIQTVLPTLHKLEAGDALDEVEDRTAARFFRQVEVLHEVTLLQAPFSNDGVKTTLRDQLVAWKRALGIRKDQTVEQRLTELFLRPIGARTVGEALQKMDESKQAADVKNREFAEANKEGIAFQQDDLIKSAKSEFFLSYLQNGHVCKEMLGYAASSDSTPLDTDLSRIDTPKPSRAIRSLYSRVDGGTKAYGDVMFVFRLTNDRYVKTSLTAPAQELEGMRRDQVYSRSDRYERFASELLSQTHENVRTGIPFTEVRAIILKNDAPQTLLDMKLDIASNGYFVTIADADGRVLFTPEEYDRLRADVLAGTEAVPESIPRLSTVVQSEQERVEIEKWQGEITQELPTVRALSRQLESILAQSLQEVGVDLRESGESAIGAEILNVGSTSRGTQVPGSEIDFDITLRLDESDLQAKRAAIEEVLQRRLGGSRVSGQPTAWRRSGIRLNGETIDLDIVFLPKMEEERLASHVAVEQRLDAYGRISEEARIQVLANIVQAKKYLKQAGIYKKLDGGIGGLGVENWILQHGGSFTEARHATLDAALDEAGALRSFDEFAKRYAILDPGINLSETSSVEGGEAKTKPRHDNFVSFLKRDQEDGYKRFIQALQKLP